MAFRFLKNLVLFFRYNLNACTYFVLFVIDVIMGNNCVQEVKDSSLRFI